MILQQRELHPAWGARKIKRRLEDLGVVDLPAVSTVSDILKRNGYIDPKESIKHIPYQRFERDNPNELWQIDFKGEFRMGNGHHCFPLTAVDDKTRFSLGVHAKTNQRLLGVQESFTLMFHEYGLPQSILCDNGNPWGNSQCIGYTAFEVWLLRLDVLPIHGRPNHPQTQGKNERFNQTLKKELISRVIIDDIPHAQRLFDPWRKMYNEERPHEAINMDVPANLYRPSTRQFPEALPTWEYDGDWKPRKVNGSGFLHIDGRKHFLSEAFANQIVAMKPSTSNPDTLKIRFGNFIIARYSLPERLFISKRIYRIEED